MEAAIIDLGPMCLLGRCIVECSKLEGDWKVSDIEGIGAFLKRNWSQMAITGQNQFKMALEGVIHPDFLTSEHNLSNGLSKRELRLLLKLV